MFNKKKRKLGIHFPWCPKIANFFIWNSFFKNKILLIFEINESASVKIEKQMFVNHSSGKCKIWDQINFDSNTKLNFTNKKKESNLSALFIFGMANQFIDFVFNRYYIYVNRQVVVNFINKSVVVGINIIFPLWKRSRCFDAWKTF